jgi:hypothetical protein
MTMNRKKQRKAILKAARWVVNHPDAWNKRQFFGTATLGMTSTGNPHRGFDIMGATFPKKYPIFKAVNVEDGNAVVAAYVGRNFPDNVIGDIGALNDKAVDAAQAARRVRAYVGRNFKR